MRQSPEIAMILWDYFSACFVERGKPLLQRWKIRMDITAPNRVNLRN